MTHRKPNKAIPFEAFARFERIDTTPVFFCEPPEWAAAAHAVVVDDTIHYLWARRDERNYWTIMHSEAATSTPWVVRHDPLNPVLIPSDEGFDDFATEYPYPFLNPEDGVYYAYYLGRRERPPKQTGLLRRGENFSSWTRVAWEPVIAVEQAFERQGSSHPSVAVVDGTIHIIYTGEFDGPPVICHATAPAAEPVKVTKDPANPVFRGTGQVWEAGGVREAEIFKGPEYFHIFYGASDGEVWRVGHVRTKDFGTFEANPFNPVFVPSEDPDAWDCDGILTPQVFAVGDTYYLLYAGMRGSEWQSGLASAPRLQA